MVSSASCLSKLLKLPLGGQYEENLSSNQNARVVKRQVLGGPNSCGKTSLLFEYAFKCAEKGDYVLFIAPKPLTKLPLFVNGRKQPNSIVLKRINMAYLANYTELTSCFASVHHEGGNVGRTRHVLIDDFDWYFKERGTRTEDTNRFAKCLAYIIDAITFWSKDLKHTQSSVETNCSFLLAETITGDSMGVEKIGLYKHWVTEFIRIQTLGNSLFQIQPAGQGKEGSDLSSDFIFRYEIDENEIKVR